MIVNKKIVLTTPICYSIDRFGFDAPDFSSWEKIINSGEGGNLLAKVLSSAVLGIDAYRVEVEIVITSGMPTFTTVGLPETSVKESKERVKSAISNTGYRFPDDRITVNLAPADIKKEGTGFDLPIA